MHPCITRYKVELSPISVTTILAHTNDGGVADELDPELWLRRKQGVEYLKISGNEVTAEFNSDDVVSIKDCLDRFYQLRSLLHSKKIRRFRYQSLGDFSHSHPIRTRLDVITLATDKLHNLTVELPVMLLLFSPQMSVPLFFRFEPPVLWLVLGHDLHIERL